MENINLLFYKTFYSKLGEDNNLLENDIVAKGKKLVSSKFYSNDYKPFDKDIAPQKLLMKTEYPGLVIGTGYAHGIDSENDIKVGFSFDYVTGQPYIPAASVKGLLRSYFEHPEVIKCFIGEELSDDCIRKLELDIFENEEISSDKTDIFFDAVVRHGDKKGNVLGFDYITPHGEDLTKNPTPIQIIKVLPDVVFEFAFNLKESKIDEHIISADTKIKLFRSIIENFGIGAKTNVGYGVLAAVSEDEENAYLYPIKNYEKPETGKYYDCTVTGTGEPGIFVNIDSLKKDALIHKSGIPDNIMKNISTYYKKGDKIVAAVIEIRQDGKINMSYESAKK